MVSAVGYLLLKKGEMGSADIYIKKLKGNPRSSRVLTLQDREEGQEARAQSETSHWRPLNTVSSSGAIRT